MCSQLQRFLSFGPYRSVPFTVPFVSSQSRSGPFTTLFVAGRSRSVLYLTEIERQERSRTKISSKDRYNAAPAPVDTVPIPVLYKVPVLEQ